MDNHPTNKGLLLKKARESKGISLETVHESTKIPMDALRSIEEGYTIRTLSQFYYRGFLKIYAQYLDIDINMVVDDYHPRRTISDPLPKIKHEEQEKEQKKEGPAQDIRSVMTPKIQDWIIRALVALIILLFCVKVFGFIAGKFSAKHKDTPKGSVVSGKKNPVKLKKVPAPEKKKTVAEEKTAPKETPVQEVKPVPVVTPQAVDQEAGKHIDVVVRAKKDNWLQVKVDGAVVFRATLKKGATETWRAKDSLELSGKDVGNLEFEFNGKIIGPVGRENRGAKRIIFDHNGFSVKQ